MPELVRIIWWSRLGFFIAAVLGLIGVFAPDRETRADGALLIEIAAYLAVLWMAAMVFNRIIELLVEIRDGNSAKASVSE